MIDPKPVPQLGRCKYWTGEHPQYYDCLDWTPTEPVVPDPLSQPDAQNLVQEMITLLNEGGWVSETDGVDDKISEWLMKARARSSPAESMGRLECAYVKLWHAAQKFYASDSLWKESLRAEAREQLREVLIETEPSDELLLSVERAEPATGIKSGPQHVCAKCGLEMAWKHYDHNHQRPTCPECGGFVEAMLRGLAGIKSKEGQDVMEPSVAVDDRVRDGGILPRSNRAGVDTPKGELEGAPLEGSAQDFLTGWWRRNGWEVFKFMQSKLSALEGQLREAHKDVDFHEAAVGELAADLKHGNEMYIAMRDRCARVEQDLAAAEAEQDRLREALRLCLENRFEGDKIGLIARAALADSGKG